MAGKGARAGGGSAPRRLSRRLFIGAGAGAAAAGLGALALERTRHGGAPALQEAGSPGGVPAQAAKPPPLADPRVRAAHLLRRAGFGGTPEEVAGYAALPAEEAADRLLAYESVPDDAALARLPKLDLANLPPPELPRWWLARMTATRRPLQERMTLFWHGLLTSSLNKVGGRRAGLMLAQNEFLRAKALGAFPEILKGISRDPAMLVYLDGDGSSQAHPNENYARELMELFSMGIGNYTETDVREAARAFTGWQVTRANEAVFRPERWDAGAKTILGQTGPFRADDVIDVLMRHPAAAVYLPRRLWSFFAYPDPEPDLVARLSDAWVKGGFSVRALVRAVLTAPEFYSPRAYRALVKSPTELVVGAVHQLGLPPEPVLLAEASARMGQQLFNPPDVSGWRGAWLSSTAWFARVNFCDALLGGPGRFSSRPSAGQSGLPSRRANRKPEGQAAYDRLAAILAQESLTTGDAAVSYFAATLVDGHLPEASRRELLGYVDGPGGEFAAAASEERVERTAGLVYLLLASPEYQLA